MTKITLLNESYRDHGYGAGAGGSIEFYFSIVQKEKDNSYTLLHRSYQCRMFLVDDFYSMNTGLSPNNPASWYFLHGSKSYMDTFITNLHILNAYEEQAGLEKTKAIRYDEKGIIVEGDIEWSNTLWKVSLYSFLLKSLAYPDGVPCGKWNEEIAYYDAFIKNRELFLHNMKNNIEYTNRNYNFYDKEEFFWSSHGAAGFYTICGGGNKAQRRILEKGVINANNSR